jgi:hypothetical protein
MVCFANIDRAGFSLSLVMLLAFLNDGGGRQPQPSQLPYPVPGVVRAECEAHLCRQISASSIDGNIRRIFVGRGANDPR